MQFGVKKRKLKWYSHVTRVCGLSKTIPQGTVQGKRREKRHRKSWADYTTEWTRRSFDQSQALVQRLDKWRLVVRRSPCSILTTLEGYGSGIGDINKLGCTRKETG